MVHFDRRTVNASSFATARAMVVRKDNWRIALEEALHAVLSGRDTGPDLLVLFASTAYSHDYPELVREAFHGSGAGCLVGCSARGVIANDDSHEIEPGIAMLALWLPGADLRPIRLHQEMNEVLADPDLWYSVNRLHPDDVRGWLVFAEPFRMDVQESVTHLRSRYPGTPMIGALTSSHRNDRQMWVFLDDHVYDEGGVALALMGPYNLDVIVSQGGEPVGEPWTITGVDKNRITTISNRPALEVMRETMRKVGWTSEKDAPVLIGFPMNEYQDDFKRGDFVVRGLLGIEEPTGSLIVGSIPRVGQTVQFHLREPRSAEVDQRRLLGDMQHRLRKDDLIAGLLCTCKGRGTAMFGHENHDASLVHSAFPELPVAGLFSFGEIGPVRGVPALNGFAMSFGVISRRPA
jgi:small ligand-binding sensory domain FIST